MNKGEQGTRDNVIWKYNPVLPSCGGAHTMIAYLKRHCTTALTAFVTLMAATTASAFAQAVDLALVLAVDASGSVDTTRFELQKRGYVAAFRHAQVLRAIRSGPAQAIAVTMVQWTGPALQVQVVGWTRIADLGDAEDFAAAIENAPRQLFAGGTSISGVIDYAMSLFPANPYRGGRRVIDISGDGGNNRGRPAAAARDDAVAAGIGINGLPILALEPDLDRYYQQNVIGGPGAFVVAAQSYDTFAEAILKKLIIEIAARPAAVLTSRGSQQVFGMAFLPVAHGGESAVERPILEARASFVDQPGLQLGGDAAPMFFHPLRGGVLVHAFVAADSRADLARHGLDIVEVGHRQPVRTHCPRRAGAPADNWGCHRAGGYPRSRIFPRLLPTRHPRVAPAAILRRRI